MTAEASKEQSMASGAQDDRLTVERAFIEGVKALDRGRQATLKRNAGNVLSEARGVGWFYSLLEADQFRWGEEELFFLVATLIAQDRKALEGRRSFKGDFGRTMARLGGPKGS